jgi:proteasome lid subunit RPN8/RPN11
VLSEVQSKSLTLEMREHAEKCFPQEACGLIVGIGKKARFVPCSNASLEPLDQFLIPPSEYAAAEDMGEILAVWHSHPSGNCTPSDADLAGCEATELPWFISALTKQGDQFHHIGPEITQPSGFQADYVGRPYVFGVFDCFSLLVDFYEREYGIKVKRFSECRINEWWKQHVDLSLIHI